MFLALLMSTTMWGATSSVPSNAPDVMLQAFYWDSYPANSGNLQYGHTGWSTLLSQVDELGEYFDLVWLPPCSQSAGGTGYIPKQYSNLNSDWGNETDLRSLISQLKTKNTRAVADIVVNHLTGNYGWCSFATMDFGSYGSFTPQASWICSTDEMNYESAAGSCQGQATGAADDGYGDEANYTSARDLDHNNAQVRAMCRAYLQWLKNDVGFDGWRYDYGKGFHHSHINEYNSAAGAYMSVVEYWDGNSSVIRSRLEDANWNNMAFDFGTKYDALNNGICSFDYSKCQGAGLLGAGLSKHAVTFVDNHDTFQRNSSEFGGQGNSMSANLKDRLLQANAYILAMPGIPCVFYPHWVTYKSEIKPMIEARHLVGVHSQSEVKDEYAEQGGYQATIVGTNGWIVLQLGNKAGNTIQGFTKKASGNGYAVWIYVNTPVEHTYTVAGSSADVFGTAWSPSLEANDMIKQDDGSYKWEKTGLTLAAGTIEFKVCEDHAWTTAYPSDNYPLTIPSAGTYTVTITFNAGTNAVQATATKTDSGSGDTPDPEEPEIAVDSMTVYFVNTLNWTKVNTFVWPASGNAYKTWPGEQAKKEAEQLHGYDIYSYKFPKTFINVIFNNGSAQTADLAWNESKPYFYPTGLNAQSKYEGTWYAKTEVPTSGSGSGDEPGGDDPQPTAAKFYVTGDTALVVGAGEDKMKAWKADAIKSEQDTLELSLPAGMYHLKVVVDGNWEGGKVKGFTALTEPVTAGLSADADDNIVFTLDEAGAVKVIYFVKNNQETFKLIGSFATSGSGSGDEPGGDDPQPTTKYYLKNNWNNGEWSWKEMTAAENNTFKLENVVFGGTGVNYNTAESDANAAWVAVAAFDGDEVGALDTVTFVLDLAAEKKIKATLLGKYNTGSGSGDEPGGDDPQPTVADGYYLMGSFNNWKPAAGYLFEVNPSNANEYMLTVTLASGDELKVAQVVDGAATTWFPPTGGNFVVDARFAGEKTIYFQPTYNEYWDAYGGYFYIAPNTATGIDEQATTMPATKVIRDGRLYIIIGSRTYTTLGQTVR